MNPIEIEGKIRALEVMMYEGRGASVRCAPAPGSDATPWPARDVVAKLVEASDILLDEHDYDGHGHELIAEARRVARAWLRQNPQ